jgi:hypothetical protein
MAAVLAATSTQHTPLVLVDDTVLAAVPTQVLGCPFPDPSHT